MRISLDIQRHLSYQQLEGLLGWACLIAENIFGKKPEPQFQQPRPSIEDSWVNFGKAQSKQSRSNVEDDWYPYDADWADHSSPNHPPQRPVQNLSPDLPFYKDVGSPIPPIGRMEPRNPLRTNYVQLLPIVSKDPIKSVSAREFANYEHWSDTPTNVVARPQVSSFQINRIIIENPQNWTVHDIKVGNHSQFACMGTMPGAHFARHLNMNILLRPISSGADFTMVVEYIGPNPEGEFFRATAYGLVSST